MDPVKSDFTCRGLAWLIGLGLIWASGGLETPTHGQAPQWIWSPQQPSGQVPIGSGYFRKNLQLPPIEQAQLAIVADGAYELFVNGRSLGRGESLKQMDRYDLSNVLRRGRNVVAVRVDNRAGNTAALAVELHIKPIGQPWRNFSSDEGWRSSLREAPDWQTTEYADNHWMAAVKLGPLGGTAPWDRRPEVDETQLHEGNRFTVQPGFSVQRLLDGEATGSLIAMAFNEFGHVIASREDGGLILIHDTEREDGPPRVRDYGDLVKHVQGILPINGDVLVTGVGPEGLGLYRLIDPQRNGRLEQAQLLLGFTGPPGEHGPHQIALGPDGFLYISVGNHSQAKGLPEEKTPVWYEGDLIQPRHEDPGGHARGIKAPGGTVVRVKLDGSQPQIVAGGLRNSYDLLFHPEGGLFLHDSDMESDMGMVWYRPTALYEVVEGGDYGWRSGWAKWPDYYLDTLPPILDTGRGSPTGGIVYDHYAFPLKYHGRMFLADWSEGRILSVGLRPEGGSFQAQSEVFLQGQPLNVTDIDVGPDGSLYFCTGGRGTNGGLYRVRWEGKAPIDWRNLGDGIAAAIRQPQMYSAWARQQIAVQKQAIGTEWGELLEGVATSPENPVRYRQRALSLMQLYGPAPSTPLLIDISQSPSEPLRAKAASLLGLRTSQREATQRLIAMLDDPDARVQRLAAESLYRSRQAVPLTSLLPLLASSDRAVAAIGRRLLECQPTDLWQSEVLASDELRVQLQGSLALASVQPDQETSQQVQEMLTRRMQGFISDRDFVDLLRVMQLWLHRTATPIEQLAEVRAQLAEEFPAGDVLINRELIRLLVHLQADSIVDRAIQYLENSNWPLADRVNLAMHMRFLEANLTPAQRFAVLRFFEQATQSELGTSFALYIMQATRDFGRQMGAEEARVFLEQGQDWPNASLAALGQLPSTLTDRDVKMLIDLDQRIDQQGLEEDIYKRLRTGIVAVLSEDGSPAAQAYLRTSWQRSPDRRQIIALGLSQHPTEENFDYLVTSLALLEPYVAAEVLEQLKRIPLAADEPEAFRQVILHGLRLSRQQESATPALELLRMWLATEADSLDLPSSAEVAAELGDSPLGQANSARSKQRLEQRRQLVGWQRWYARQYPDLPAAELPDEGQQLRWTMERIEEFLDGESGRSGDPTNGQIAFEKAQCSACHRFGSGGGALGPDLTALSRRFTRKELLESILYPSHVISDQWRSTQVLTRQGEVFTGLVSETRPGYLTIRRSDLTEVTIAVAEVDQTQPSKQSLMPSGLLEELTMTQIRDMLSYLGFLPAARTAAQPAGNR
jgi:putative heme-binding domain-containing protein